MSSKRNKKNPTTKVDETTDRDHSDGNTTTLVQEPGPQQVAASDLLQLLAQQQRLEAEQWQRLDLEREEETRGKSLAGRSRAACTRGRKTPSGGGANEERQAREKEIDQLNKTIAALLTERDKPRLQPPKLPTLADGDDVDAVLTRFEQHMVTYDVPRHQ